MLQGKARVSGFGFRPPHGDWAMRVRFWGENTRDGEKSVSLSLGVFIGASNVSPRAFHPKARSHFPITALCAQTELEFNT